MNLRPLRLLVLLALSPGPVIAATLAVPQDHATIGEALGSALPCDVVEVAPGTYDETVWIPPGVTLRSTGGPTVTILDGGGTDEVGGGIPEVVAMANGAVIQGFTLRNADVGAQINGQWHEVLDCVIEDVEIGVRSQGATAWLQGLEVVARDKAVAAGGGKLWIDDLVVTDTPVGIDLVGTYGRILRPSTLRVGRGAFLRESNVWIAEGVFEQGEVGLVLSLGEVEVAGNVFEDNLVGVQLLEGAPLLYDNDFVDNSFGVVADFSEAELLANRISGSDLAGLSVGIGSSLRAASNLLVDNRIGVEVLSGEPLLHNSTILGGQIGVELRGGAAILRNNLITGAVVGIDGTLAQGGTSVGSTGLWDNGTDVVGVSTTDDVLGDPLLDADLVPQAGSSALDAGDPAGELRDGDGSIGDLGHTGGPDAARLWAPPPPTAPTIGVQPVQEWSEGSEFGIFAYDFGDVNDDPLRVGWDIDASDGLDYCDGFSNGIPYLVPDDGDFEVYVRIQDSEGFEVFATVPIRGINEAPDLFVETLPDLFEGTEAPVYVAAPDPSDFDTVVVDFDGDGDGEFEQVDRSSGFLWWTPVDDGPLTLRTRARDEDGGIREHELDVVVANLPPSLVTGPPTVLGAGVALDFELVVTDPSPTDTVTASLEDGPDGMELDGLRLTWEPPQDEQRTYEWTLRLQDEDGGEAMASGTITAGTPPTPGEGCNCRQGGGAQGGLLLLPLLALRRRGQGAATRQRG